MASIKEGPNEKKFFVIEDDPDHQKIAEITLHTAGFSDITFFDTGEAALEYFRTTDPVGRPAELVILIDLMLPNISGLDILQRLRQDSRWQHCRMIVLTCSTSIEDRTRSLEYGADAFLSKPLSLESFRQSVFPEG